MGAVTPVGTGVAATWDSLVNGRGGAGPLQAFDPKELSVRIAAEVKDFDGDAIFGKRRARHLDRFVQLAVVATREAIESSGVDVTHDPNRVGVVYGSGIGGIATLEKEILQMAQRGPSKVSPYMCPMMIPNMAAGEIAMEWGLLGPNTCTVTACAASAHAIGDAADMIRLGRADVMIAGGSEAAINPISMAGFAAMKALSERNDDPEHASRPFDAGRDGFVAGEGAATLVLESLDSALARGATILAELVGYGLTSDAFHITAPHPEGNGAIRCMQMALDQAGLAPSEVGYINAHGTSTPPNDRIETMAVKAVFGSSVPVSSTKSMTGHLLGAAGALEAIACVQVLQTDTLPPTINYDDPDPACDLDYVPNVARPGRVDAVLSNSFGFGGHNGTLLFKRYPTTKDASL
ncbi:MAG: beta-ketoacyl-ACP synthase II [Actinomycetota bacterium]|nr:beta-ketoacyl-ACP synthase II [Actinomycetota bacterium]